jgi:hypothetical protein
MLMKSKQSMLDHCKKVLHCVSFDPRLFKKEYRKAIFWLMTSEVRELKQWIRENKYINNFKQVRS